MFRSNGVNRSNGRAPGPPAVERAPAMPDKPASCQAEAINEAALVAGTGAVLIGIAFGLGVAKYAQAWAGTALHPAAGVGALIVLASAALALATCGRYLRRAICLAAPGQPSRTLLTLCIFLVLVAAWVALAIIVFAGWELPLTPSP